MSEEALTHHKKQLAMMRVWLDGRGFYLAADALEVCRQLEHGTRKDGETPKFHHQLSVARFVVTLEPHLALPEQTIAAAFLHDVIEDHGDEWTLEGLEHRFGKRVSDAVWLLSKKGRGFKKDPEFYFEEIAPCPIASIVKAVDRAHNIQTMVGVFGLEKQRQYLQEVEDHFFPMIRTARRMNPRQFGAYENTKILLRCQAWLIKRIIEAQES